MFRLQQGERTLLEEGGILTFYEQFEVSFSALQPVFEAANVGVEFVKGPAGQKEVQAVGFAAFDPGAGGGAEAKGNFLVFTQGRKGPGMEKERLDDEEGVGFPELVTGISQSQTGAEPAERGEIAWGGGHRLRFSPTRRE